MAGDKAETRRRRQARYAEYHPLYHQILAPPWCVYCGQLATSQDHLWPLSYAEKWAPPNMMFTVPACYRCNSIGARYRFSCFDLKHNYIWLTRREDRYPPYVVPDMVKAMYQFIRKRILAQGQQCDIPEAHSYADDPAPINPRFPGLNDRQL